MLAAGDQSTHDLVPVLSFYAAQGVDNRNDASLAYYNDAEVAEVVKRVDELIQLWPKDWSKNIGVLTPYHDQVFTHAQPKTLRRFDASCRFYRPDASWQQVVPSLLTSSSCILIFAETTCIKSARSSQLAASLLTTCSRLVTIKLEQAMRTHPDISLVIADLLQLVSRITLPALTIRTIKRNELDLIFISLLHLLSFAQDRPICVFQQ